MVSGRRGRGRLALSTLGSGTATGGTDSAGWPRKAKPWQSSWQKGEHSVERGAGSSSGAAGLWPWHGGGASATGAASSGQIIAAAWVVVTR